MIDAHLTYDGGEVRTYVLAEPLTTRQMTHVAEDGTPVYTDETVTVTDLTVTIPQQWEHSVTVPAVLVTGSGPGVNENIDAHPTAVSWEQVLDDLGLHLAPGAPPAPPQPHLVGAVPTEADLPGEPEPLGIYLVRADGDARCHVDGEWLTQPWAPGCEQFFGLTPDQVPDLGGTS